MTEVTAKRNEPRSVPTAWGRWANGTLSYVAVHPDAKVKMSRGVGQLLSAFVEIEDTASMRIFVPDVVAAIDRMLDAEAEAEVPKRPIEPGEWFERDGQRFQAVAVDNDGDLLAVDDEYAAREFFSPAMWATNPGTLCDPPVSLRSMEAFMVTDTEGGNR